MKNTKKKPSAEKPNSWNFGFYSQVLTIHLSWHNNQVVCSKIHNFKLGTFPSLISTFYLIST